MAGASVALAALPVVGLPEKAPGQRRQEGVPRGQRVASGVRTAASAMDGRCSGAPPPQKAAFRWRLPPVGWRHGPVPSRRKKYQARVVVVCFVKFEVGSSE